MEKIIQLIQNEVSEKRLYNSVKEVSNFHRIQASTGFRDAANFCNKKLNDLGIQSKVLSFKADENQWYLEQKLFREWDCKDAWLDLCETGERLCDFTEEAMSVIQKSYPADYSNQPLEIVNVERVDEAYLDTLDLKGKLAFVHVMPRNLINPICTKYGAVGFISDFLMEMPPIRTRADAADTLNYTSFWWKHTEDEPQVFGFVLPPRKGDALRKLCEKMAKEHEADPTKPQYPTCTCKVDSSIYPGYMEVVEAVLPGKSTDEILICAHLCHPRSSANDNASGTSGGMEVIRALKALQDKGLITLEKTVRLVLVPEMTGTYCWLSTLDNYDHIKGAINMDMVGAKQNGFWGPVTITPTNIAANSPVTAVASYALKYARQMVGSLTGEKVPVVNSSIETFMGGSDHTIYSDPTINIPCIMLGQWPDRFYHTSSDTLECIDSKVLKFSTTFAAAYVYVLSNFNEAMHKEVVLHHVQLMNKDLERIADLKDCANKKAKAQYYVDYYVNCIENLNQYAPVDVTKDKDYIASVGKATMEYFAFEDEKEVEADPKYDYVPVRKFVGPINDLEDYKAKYPEHKKALEDYSAYTRQFGFGARMITGNVVNYMDGTRTLNEIAKCIALENKPGNIEVMDALVHLLEQMGLVEIK